MFMHITTFFLIILVLLNPSKASAEEVSASGVALEINYFLEEFDGFVEEMIYELSVEESFDSDMYKNFFKQHVLPSDIADMRQTSFKPSVLYRLSYAVPFMMTGVLMLGMTDTSDSYLSSLPTSGAHLAIGVGLWKLFHYWYMFSTKNHIKHNLQKTSALHFRQILGKLINWGKNRKELSEERLSLFESQLSAVVERRIANFDYFAKRVEWYGNSIDHEIAWKNLMRRYLSVWVAQTYLEITKERVAKRGVSAATHKSHKALSLKVTSCFQAMEKANTSRQRRNRGGDQDGMKVFN